MRDFLLSRLSTGPVVAITGMALGVDQLFGLVALELKAKGYKVRIHAAMPCWNQGARWKDRSFFEAILQGANVQTYVHDGPYVPWCMQRRNEFMVDACEELLAVWDGSPGGTGNCIRYAKKKGKPIFNLLGGKI